MRDRLLTALRLCGEIDGDGGGGDYGQEVDFEPEDDGVTAVRGTGEQGD